MINNRLFRESIMTMSMLSTQTPLGDMLQFAFEEIYYGDCSFEKRVQSLKCILYRLVSTGILSYWTASRMITFLNRNMDDSSIVSLTSEHICMLHANNSIDEFELTGLMKWFTHELVNDIHFSRSLNGHHNYTGLRECLNKITYYNDLDGLAYCIDVVCFKDKYFFTCINEKSDIVLYESTYSRDMRIKPEKAKIRAERLSDGHIYWMPQCNHILVNLKGNIGYSIDVNFNNFHTFIGEIIRHPKQNKVLVSQYKDLLMYNTEDKSMTLISDESNTNTVVLENDKNRNLAITTAWGFIINSAFLLELNISEILSDRLICFEIYQPPFPLTYKAISEKLEYITKHIIENKKGKLIKNGYANLVLWVNKLEKDFQENEILLQELLTFSSTDAAKLIHTYNSVQAEPYWTTISKFLENEQYILSDDDSEWNDDDVETVEEYLNSPMFHLMQQVDKKLEEFEGVIDA